MNLFDIILALPVAAAAWVLLSNGVALFSLLKAIIALTVLFCVLAFINFPESWTKGSFLYAPMMSAVKFLTGLWGSARG